MYVLIMNVSFTRAIQPVGWDLIFSVCNVPQYRGVCVWVGGWSANSNSK